MALFKKFYTLHCEMHDPPRELSTENHSEKNGARKSQQ